MKKRFLKKAGLGSVSVLLLASCYQAMVVLTAQGEKVQLFPHPEDYPQCLFVNDFRSMTLSGRDNSYQQALSKIKNKVAIYQGTHLKIVASDTDELVTVIQGEGYRCPLSEDGRILDMTLDSIYSETE